MLVMPGDDEAPNPGDPTGRRVARRRAMLLSEAGFVARALEILLERANLESPDLAALKRAITERELAELQKAEGRIESRKRFKGHAPQPISDKRTSAHLFVDEAGKSFPEPALPGPTFFALGGVCMSEQACAKYRVDADLIKVAFFNSTEITFHEPDMRFRDRPFSFNGDVLKQREFDAALEQLIAQTDFTALGVGIRKDGFAKEFVATGVDPYLPLDAYATAITMLLERYVDHLAMSPTKLMGRLTFESQGALEDAYHQLEYARVLLEGSQWVSEKSFRQWLETGLRFIPKQGSDPTEIADLFSRELFEWIRSDCQEEPKFWNLFSRKIYCRGDGRMGKFGVKVFPDVDIRDRIEAHRRACGATE